MFVVLFMPNGLVGLPQQLKSLRGRIKRKKSALQPEAITPGIP